jgi:hypothetical protein
MFSRHGRLVGCSEQLDRRKVGAIAAHEQVLENLFDVGLYGAGGQMQDAHVLDVGALAAIVAQGVVRSAEHQRWEQLLAVAGYCDW